MFSTFLQPTDLSCNNNATSIISNLMTSYLRRKSAMILQEDLVLDIDEDHKYNHRQYKFASRETLDLQTNAKLQNTATVQAIDKNNK